MPPVAKSKGTEPVVHRGITWPQDRTRRLELVSILLCAWPEAPGRTCRMKAALSSSFLRVASRPTPVRKDRDAFRSRDTPSRWRSERPLPRRPTPCGGICGRRAAQRLRPTAEHYITPLCTRNAGARRPGGRLREDLDWISGCHRRGHANHPRRLSRGGGPGCFRQPLTPRFGSPQLVHFDERYFSSDLPDLVLCRRSGRRDGWGASMLVGHLGGRPCGFAPPILNTR